MEPHVISDYANVAAIRDICDLDHQQLLATRDLKWIVREANGLDPAWQSTIQWSNCYKRYVLFGNHPLFFDNYAPTTELVEKLAAYAYFKNYLCVNFYTNDLAAQEDFEKHRASLFSIQFKRWLAYCYKYCNEDDKNILKAMEKGDGFSSNLNIFPTDIERRRAMNYIHASWLKWYQETDADKEDGYNWRAMSVFTRYYTPYYETTERARFEGGCTWCLDTATLCEPTFLRGDGDDFWIFLTCTGCHKRFYPSCNIVNQRGFIRAVNIEVFFSKAVPIEKRWRTTKRARVLVEEQEERDVKKQKTQ